MRSSILKQRFNNFIYLVPFSLLFLVFTVYPIVNNFYVSLFEWDGLSPDKVFVGLQNYLDMFRDRVFGIAIKNNFLFLITTVIVQNAIGLTMALLLDRKLAGGKIYRTVFFLPVIIAPVIVGYVFGRLLNFTDGPINNFFRFNGLDAFTVDWLGNPDIAIFTIIATSIWQYSGFAFVLYQAGLQNIPEELYEAATIDGANYLQRTTRITFPMLRSTHFSLLILTSIGSIKVFDIVFVMTGGGPAHFSEVLGTHLYIENFQLNHTGYASTVSVFVFLLALIITMFQLRLYKRVRL